jgi:putative ABC transport system permease protein
MNRGMSALDIIRQASLIITGNRLRSLLLILGVAIGVSTLLAIYTIVDGLSGRIRNDIVSAAKPYMQIARYHGLGGEDIDEKMRRPQLEPECIDILRDVEGVDQVDYMISNSGGTILTYEDERTNIVQIFGASAIFHNLYSISLDTGRFFTFEEQSARRRVCVLGDGPVQTLFENKDPIGRKLRLYGVEYTIVGAMENRRHVLGQMGDNYVVIPWTSFEKDFSGDNNDRTMSVTVADGYEPDEVRADVIGALRIERNLSPAEENDFDVVASETYADLMDKITGGVALVLVVLSSIGLMVGGIGVMNIMLISVTERTREIGVRLALGGRRRDILWQILFEAATLTGIGGLVGIVIGYGMAWGGTRLLHFPFHVNPIVVMIAFLFSAGIGIFFGLYPASRASKMDPVEALRYE